MFRSDRSIGILLMLAASVVAPFVDASAKASALAYSAVFLTWARFYSLTLVLGIVTLVRHGYQGLYSVAPGVHMVRGALFAIANGLFFLSLGYLGLAEAFALYFVQPLFVQLLARVFLKEVVGWRRWLGAALGFAGALIIISPDGTSVSLAALLPIGSAAFNAAYSVLTRAARDTDPVLSMQLHAGLAATAVASIGLAAMLLLDIPVLARAPGLLDWTGFMLLGALTALSLVLNAAAFQRAEASLLAPFRYAEIFVAVAIGVVWFGEVPDSATMIGSILIIIGGLISMLRRHDPPANSQFASA